MSDQVQTLNCPICEIPVRNSRPAEGGTEFDCKSCGRYRLTREAQSDLLGMKLKPRDRTALSYAIRRATDSERSVLLTIDLMESIRRRATLPAGDEVLDELVLWIGSHTKYPGHTTQAMYPEYRGVLGAQDEDAFAHLTEWAMLTGWFVGHRSAAIGKANGIKDCALSLPGWERYRELTRTRTDSRSVFMAMQYNDAELDRVVTDYFAPAVAKTGLTLKRLDHEQPAGLIDDQLRVRIRTARMVVCDLTHGNRGAYWEGGYAEGLGKPVIYIPADVMCSATKLTRTTPTSIHHIS